jgi:hypothetical protein
MAEIQRKISEEKRREIEERASKEKIDFMKIFTLIETFLIVVIIGLVCASCIKTIYVGDEEAITYRILYEQCHKEYLDCNSDLTVCVNICDEMQLTNPN